MSRNFRLRITPALSLDGQLEPLDPLPGVASGWSRGETRSRISPCSPAASAEIANRLGNPTVAAAPPASKDSRNAGAVRSEEHTSELQSLMRISYAVFCLKKKKKHNIKQIKRE